MTTDTRSPEELRAELHDAYAANMRQARRIAELEEGRRRHRRHIRTLRNQLTWQTKAFHATLYTFDRFAHLRSRDVIVNAIKAIADGRSFTAKALLNSLVAVEDRDK